MTVELDEGRGNDQQGESPVKIFKLHGSCNWSIRHRNDQEFAINYRDILFAEDIPRNENIAQDSSADFGFSLVQPSYIKDPAQIPLLNQTWLQAQQTIIAAEEIIVIGYSLPPPDGPSRTMLSLALKANDSIKTLKVVLGSNREDIGYKDGMISVNQVVRPPVLFTKPLRITFWMAACR